MDAAEHPLYERFDTGAGFQAAVDRLIEQFGRELRIFDRDLSALRMNDPERVARIERFLSASRTRRLFIVVHDTDYVTRKCPRMMALLARFSHAIQINRTHDHIRSLQDAFLVLDSIHYVRRASSNFFRGALGFGDEPEALLMRQRFMEIWEASYPAVSATTAGL
ncbi:MAG TPA: hypothetical protein VFB08_18355 [Burkholderiales bacterium]|nr:hypothetical protein [Burkholderiales bacterium]